MHAVINSHKQFIQHELVLKKCGKLPVMTLSVPKTLTMPEILSLFARVVVFLELYFGHFSTPDQTTGRFTIFTTVYPHQV